MIQQKTDAMLRLTRATWIIVILLFTLVKPLCAQQKKIGATLYGTVIDEHATPLVGATVAIESKSLGAMTNAQGQFTLEGIPSGVHTFTIRYIGYRTITKKITLAKGERKRAVFELLPEDKMLSEVMVTAKGKARKIQEQAMPVSVISMAQLQGTVSDIEGILAKTVGVSIRATGGVGSASRVNLRGLEGKRVGMFIDETSISDQSDFLNINDIPVDMIERIEIYKGIVPAKLGGSSMGGAVNLVIREYPERYADVSYTLESFNTHKGQVVLKRNLKDTGLVIGAGGGITYSDNNYTMESPYIPGLKIKRQHDKYRKIVSGGSLKATKWWFDKIELEPAYISTYQQLQGIEYDIRQAYTKSDLFILANKLKKTDFFLEGLDFDMSTGVGYSRYSLVDTAKTWYDWDGKEYATPSIYGGEILGNSYPSFSKNKKFTFANKLNLEYILSENHSVNFNSVVTMAYGWPLDSLKVKGLGKQIDFNSSMKSWVAGLTYDFRTSGDRFLNSLTGKYYLYTMDTKSINIYQTTPPEDIAIRKSSFGFSDAMRYRFTPTLMAKLSGGYDVRIPAENELLGDGNMITASPQLIPERNLSFNMGLLLNMVGEHPSNLQVELSGYYMYLKDMIRFVKGFLGAQYQNFGEMRTLGAELEVKADLFPWFFAYGNVTYQDLRDTRKFVENSNIPNPTRGLRMPNIPFFMANAGIELHQENLFGGAGHNSRLFADFAFVEEYFYDFEFSGQGKRRIPRSAVLDLGVEHSFMNQRIFISGQVKNLTNRKLISEFNRPLPGRSFWIKLRYVFK